MSPDSGDLRDRLAAALHTASATLPDWDRLDPSLHDGWRRYADAVLPIVEAETTRARTEGAAAALKQASEVVPGEGPLWPIEVASWLLRGSAQIRARNAEALRPGEPTP